MRIRVYEAEHWRQGRPSYEINEGEKIAEEKKEEGKKEKEKERKKEHRIEPVSMWTREKP